MKKNSAHLIILISFAILLPFLVWSSWNWCSYGMMGIMDYTEVGVFHDPRAPYISSIDRIGSTLSPY